MAVSASLGCAALPSASAANIESSGASARGAALALPIHMAAKSAAIDLVTSWILIVFPLAVCRDKYLGTYKFHSTCIRQTIILDCSGSFF
jgi:hypothetical protein